MSTRSISTSRRGCRTHAAGIIPPSAQPRAHHSSLLISYLLLIPAASRTPLLLELLDLADRLLEVLLGPRRQCRTLRREASIFPCGLRHRGVVRDTARVLQDLSVGQAQEVVEL